VPQAGRTPVDAGQKSCSKFRQIGTGKPPRVRPSTWARSRQTDNWEQTTRRRSQERVGRFTSNWLRTGRVARDSGIGCVLRMRASFPDKLMQTTLSQSRSALTQNLCA